MTEVAGKLVVLATGGTGGHVFPAEALVGQLAARGVRMALITDRRGGAFKGALATLETYPVRAGGIAGRGLIGRLWGALELLLGAVQALGMLRRLKPDVIIGFGGYASAPTMLAASFLGRCPTVLHEQNAVLGRANRLFAGQASRIATAFEQVRGVSEAAAAKVRHVGMPVRQAVLDRQGAPYGALKSEVPLELFIFGGSQGAHIFSEVVPAALARLSEPLRRRLRVTQQCRSEDLEETRRAYAKSAIKAMLQSFFDDVPERLAAAHLVIARAGASTVAEIAVVGRPAILVPYPYAADDHQRYNAHAIDDTGGGWLMPQEAFTPETLAERLESLFAMPGILQRTAASAARAGRPDAAVRLADLVCDLLRGGGGDSHSPDQLNGADGAGDIGT